MSLRKAVWQKVVKSHSVLVELWIMLLFLHICTYLGFSAFLSQTCITFIIIRKIKSYSFKGLTNKGQSCSQWPVCPGPMAVSVVSALSGCALCSPLLRAAVTEMLEGASWWYSLWCCGSLCVCS